MRIGVVASSASLLMVLMGAAAAQQPDITVLSGGVGETEQQSLVAREREFNLKLVFSLIQGNYVADVSVTVSDGKGRKLIERSDDGPIVLARLPAGEYSVVATHGGLTLSRKVKVIDGRLRTEYLRWPADPEQDLPVSRWLDKG